jgi:hypothetical protein
MDGTSGQRVRETLRFLRSLADNENAQELAQGIRNIYITPAGQAEASSAEALRKLLAEADQIRTASDEPASPQVSMSTPPHQTSSARRPATNERIDIDAEAHAALRQQAEQESNNLKLFRLSQNLPAGGEAAAHADLRRIAREKLQGRDLVIMLGHLNQHLPPGAEFAAHTELRNIAWKKLEGEDLVDAIIGLQGNRPHGVLPIDAAEHLALRRHAEQASSHRSYKLLSQNLPLGGGEAAAHRDLRRIVGETLRGRPLVTTLGDLSELLPPGDEIAAHTDLRRIASEKLSGEDISSALVRLGQNLPAGGEAAAHADLCRIAIQTQGRDGIKTLNDLEATRPDKRDRQSGHTWSR